MVNNFSPQTSIFNRIEEFCPYSFPPDLFRWGEKMPRTLKMVAIAAMLVVAAIATILSVTVAALLVVSCSLSYATGPNLGYRRDLQAMAEPISLGVPTAAPVVFLAISRELNPEMQRVSFNISADVVAESFDVSRALNSVTGLASFDRPVAAPVPLAPLPTRRLAHARPIGFDPSSPSPAVFYGLPWRLEENVDRINFDIPSLAPMAFVRFCTQYPQDCKVRGSVFRPELVSLTKLRRAELVKVNRDVNHAITPHNKTNDVSAEEWLVSPREGDCKDYAVTKRHELLARGWPSSSLLLTEVVVAPGEHHLVLVVRTREDDLVLDNLNENVHPVSQSSYQWVRAQHAKNPKFWSTIHVTRATQMAMNAR
jgi:predicted transglutaminase-like cysteine proteinase